jgi:hypothetical protein
MRTYVYLDVCIRALLVLSFAVGKTSLPLMGVDLCRAEVVGVGGYA